MTRAAPTLLQDESEDEMLTGPHRRCIVTGEVKPKEELLRFVVAPDGRVVPDLKGNLPGRGMWVGLTRANLETAVKKRLFARASKGKGRADDTLASTVERLLRERLLGHLGLLRRQGGLVAGFEKTREALAGNKALVWVEAADGADDGRAKLAKVAGNIRCLAFFTREELSRALGREEVVHAAVLRAAQAGGLLDHIERLAGFIE